MILQRPLLLLLAFFTATYIQQSSAQVNEFQPVAVVNRDKCFHCCSDLVKEDGTLLESACQTGCDNNLGGIDDGVAAQLDSFNAGSGFFRAGVARFNGVQYFCSVGGSIQEIFVGQVDEADCDQCCESLNTEFDVDGFVSFAACIAACDPAFDGDCADLVDVDAQQGCTVGLLFRDKTAVNFADMNHFCSDNGELFSMQAIQVSQVDGAGAVQDSECSLCCDDLAEETNVGADNCKLGCNPTVDCAEDAANQADCEVGRSLAATSVAKVVGGSEITCLAPGFVERFVNLDLLVNEVNDEEILIVVGGTVGGALVLAVLIFLVSRRRGSGRKGTRVERDVLGPTQGNTIGSRFMNGVSSGFESMTFGFGARGKRTKESYDRGGNNEYDESIGYPPRDGPQASARGKKKGAMGRFRNVKRKSKVEVKSRKCG